MWALRRASNPLKFRVLSSGLSRILVADSDILNGHLRSLATVSECPQVLFKRSEFFHNVDVHSNFYMRSHGLSSQAGAKGGESEDESEDGFSELEELASESELSDDEESDHALELDAETDSRKKKSTKVASLELLKAITSPGLPIQTILNKWVEEGKDLGAEEITFVMTNLRKRRLYMKALQFSEWLETNKQIDFVEKDYSSRLDLIAKVLGIQKAEDYIQKIPKSYRGEHVYRTLLANCVAANNVKKAEEVFNKMKELKFSVTAFTCNQLLLLYKRVDKRKIADVLLLMEKENVKPTLFTYKTLIDTKGQSNDIPGMDQIVSTMKAEGIEPDTHTKSKLAKHYAIGGLKEKALDVLKEIEGGDLEENRWVCRFVLPIYADLGEVNEVRRVWKVCESNPRVHECIAAIEAWGKLKKIDVAEAVFHKMLKGETKRSSRHYSAMLKVYANHKMLIKGKDLVKQMGESGCRIGPLTWDALVKLYVDSGEVEKADSLLTKAIQQNKIRPLFSSFMTIMDQYAKRGDVHNAEKIFHKMKRCGYIARLRQYNALVETYINANIPAYGMRERLKADNVFPNKSLSGQLAKVDAFRKTSASDLLD